MKNSLIIFLFITTSTLIGANNEKDSLLTRYSVRVENSSKDIFIMDNQTNKEFKWGRVPNCYCSHYHFAEYHHPNLYVIRRFDTSIPDWKDELWVYSGINKGKLLFKKQGFDFHVNHKQTLLSSYNVDTLIVIDLVKNKTHKIRISDDKKNGMDYGIASMRWDSDKDIVWGVLSSISFGHYSFFSYEYSAGKLEKYRVPEGCEDDYDINPDLGLLLYSDYPFIVDAETGDDLIKSKTKIHLYVFDFKTNQQKLLMTSIAEMFNPKWITNGIIEYNSLSANKRERITYIK